MIGSEISETSMLLKGEIILKYPATMIGSETQRYKNAVEGSTLLDYCQGIMTTMLWKGSEMPDSLLLLR